MPKKASPFALASYPSTSAGYSACLLNYFRQYCPYYQDLRVTKYSHWCPAKGKHDHEQVNERYTRVRPHLISSTT